MSKKLYCQHPYELEKDERMQRLDKKFPDSGHGVFWKVYHRIRLGNGTYPVSALMAEIAGSNPQRQHRLKSVLCDFGLFLVENQMVSLAPGLTLSELHPRGEQVTTTGEKLKRIEQEMREGYAGNLFPEECRAMDEDTRRQATHALRLP